jgi:hypothetical protein
MKNKNDGRIKLPRGTTANERAKNRVADKATNSVLPTLSLMEEPRVVSPMNACTGLYVWVLASERVDASVLLEFVRPEVKKRGYNPDGQGFLGLPTEHGVLSRTYAMWFYDKARA